MNRFIVIGASVIAAAQAQAAETGNFKFTGQIRLDHVSAQQEVTSNGTTTKSSEGAFKLNRARTVFEGSLDKDISYRIKFYLDRAHDPDTGSGKAYDGIDKGLVEAKLVHKWTDAFSLEIGRLEINSMSVEGFYSSMDSYSATDAVIFRKPGSSNGVAGVYSVAGQLLTLQVVNSPGYDADGKGTTYKTTSNDLTTSVMWNGSLLDGVVRPIVSYANLRRHDVAVTPASGSTPAVTTTSAAYDQAILGVGTAIVLGDTTLELEYDAIDIPAYKKNKDVNVKAGKDHVDSAVASVRQKVLPNLLAIVKYDYDKAKLDLVKTQVGKASVAVEFRPNSNAFRYHANYELANKSVKDPSKAEVKTKRNTFLVGAAASI